MNLKVKCKTWKHKTSRRKQMGKAPWHWSWKRFWIWLQKHLSKSEQVELHQIASAQEEEKKINKMKRQPTELKNIFASCMAEKQSRSVISDSLWPHGLYSPWNSLGQYTGVGSLSLLQGIFPIQGSNPGLLHCRQILYQLTHQGSPGILEWVASPPSSRSSPLRNWTSLLQCRWILIRGQYQNI